MSKGRVSFKFVFLVESTDRTHSLVSQNQLTAYCDSLTFISYLRSTHSQSNTTTVCFTYTQQNQAPSSSFRLVFTKYGLFKISHTNMFSGDSFITGAWSQPQSGFTRFPLLPGDCVSLFFGPVPRRPFSPYSKGGTNLPRYVSLKITQIFIAV